MELKTKELKNALDKCGVVVKRDVPAIPELGGSVWLSANKDLVLSASDLYNFIKVRVGVSGEIDACGLPYYSFSRFLNKPDGDVSLTASKDNLVAKRYSYGEVSFVLKDINKFPSHPDIKPSKELDAKLLCSALSLVITGCVDKDDSRPVLQGINIKDKELAAADGFRLYVYHHDGLCFGLGDKSVILPRESAKKVIKLFSQSDKIKVCFEVGNAVFDDGAVTFMCHLTAGNFPNYQQLIPDNLPHKVVFSVPLMAARIDMIAGDESNETTRFIFQNILQHDGVCFIQASRWDLVDYNLEVPVRLLTPEVSKIALNTKYFKEAIKPFSLCEMSLSSPAAPVKLTGNIDGLTVIVMPMFVQW